MWKSFAHLKLVVRVTVEIFKGCPACEVAGPVGVGVAGIREEVVRLVGPLRA